MKDDQYIKHPDFAYCGVTATVPVYQYYVNFAKSNGCNYTVTTPYGDVAYTSNPSTSQITFQIPVPPLEEGETYGEELSTCFYFDTCGDELMIGTCEDELNSPVEEYTYNASYPWRNGKQYAELIVTAPHESSRPMFGIWMSYF
jgi:hypothetical protein